MSDREEKYHVWEKRIEEWKSSCQSAVKWCEEQEIAYGTFCYWKRKLNTPVKEEVVFEELEEKNSAIELRWGDICLYLEQDFDITTLERCLIAFRKVGC